MRFYKTLLTKQKNMPIMGKVMLKYIISFQNEVF